MICDDALTLLVDSDLDSPPSVLQTHLDGCARCRAVWSALRDDTAMVANVLRAHPVAVGHSGTSSWGRRATWLIPVPVVAAIVVLFARAPLPVSGNAVEHASASGPVVAQSVVPSAVAAPVAAPVAGKPKGAVGVRRSTGASESLAVFQPIATPAEPTLPLKSETIAFSASTATPPARILVDSQGTASLIASAAIADRNPVVLHPSNRKITVVWFY